MKEIIIQFEEKIIAMRKELDLFAQTLEVNVSLNGGKKAKRENADYLGTLEVNLRSMAKKIDKLTDRIEAVRY